MKRVAIYTPLVCVFILVILYVLGRRGCFPIYGNYLSPALVLAAMFLLSPNAHAVRKQKYFRLVQIFLACFAVVGIALMFIQIHELAYEVFTITSAVLALTISIFYLVKQKNKSSSNNYHK